MSIVRVAGPAPKYDDRPYTTDSTKKDTTRTRLSDTASASSRKAATWRNNANYSGQSAVYIAAISR